MNTISKVFERVIYDRMISFLMRFALLTSSQHGFLKNKSTETALFEFHDYLTKELDAGQHVVGLYFDLSKAFDSLNIDLIIVKLEALGFRGRFLDFLESYLSNRKLSARVNNVISPN